MPKSTEFKDSSLQEFMAQQVIRDPVLWYYTPLALDFTRDIPGSAIVYDCMDELSAFRGAPVGLRAAESRAVFSGRRGIHRGEELV